MNPNPEPLPWGRSVPDEEQFKAYVESRGGVYFGTFQHPLSDQDRETYWMFKAPQKMELHSFRYGKKSEGELEYLCAFPLPMLEDDERPGRIVGTSMFLQLENGRKWAGWGFGPQHFYRKEFPHLVGDMGVSKTAHPPKPRPAKARKRKSRTAS